MSDHRGAPDHPGSTDQLSSTAETAIAPWLRSLADAGPNPGGGAAAAILSGIAAALAEMAAGYTLDAAAAPAPEWARQLREQVAMATAVREAAPALADKDATSSAGFARAYDEPEGSNEREAELQSASIAAAQSAVAMGHHAASLVPLIRELSSRATALIQADVGVAACTLAASVRAAAINAAVDLRLAGSAAAGHADLLDELGHPGRRGRRA